MALGVWINEIEKWGLRKINERFLEEFNFSGKHFSFKRGSGSDSLIGEGFEVKKLGVGEQIILVGFPSVR